jgi:hypothetical protein
MIPREITVISTENHTKVSVVGTETTTAFMNLKLWSGIITAKQSSGSVKKKKSKAILVTGREGP